MAKDKITLRHNSELFNLKMEQKKAWSQLLKKQEDEIIKNANVAGAAARNAKERDEHNIRYDKMKNDLIDRQQKELEEFKKVKELQKEDNEMER